MNFLYEIINSAIIVESRIKLQVQICFQLMRISRRLVFMDQRKILLTNQCVNGAAANMFQKNAMGKFFKTVPTHMAGS